MPIGHKAAAWILIVAAVGVGIYFGNPAIALLGGLFVRLVIGVNPVSNSTTLSKLSLQTAIVLLGFTLGVDRLIGVSAEYGVTVGIYVIGTLALGGLLFHLLGCNRQEGGLLSAGTAICGGTAIATLSPITGAQPRETAVAMALVFLLNAVALFSFPYIGQALNLSQEVFGAWVALAVHDTSSVVATAAIYGDEAAEVAATVKLGRTLWLIPVVFAASVFFRPAGTTARARLPVPGFVLMFISAAIVSSLIEFPVMVTQALGGLSKALLVVALALIGLEINRETLRELSLRSVFFGVGLWLLVAPGALLLVLYL